MSVEEYEGKCKELSRHFHELLQDEELRCQRFFMGWRREIRGLVPLESGYANLVGAALKVELSNSVCRGGEVVGNNNKRQRGDPGGTFGGPRNAWRHTNKFRGKPHQRQNNGGKGMPNRPPVRREFDPLRKGDAGPPPQCPECGRNRGMSLHLGGMPQVW